MLAYPPSVSVLPDESVGQQLGLERRDDAWVMNALPRDHSHNEIDLRLRDAQTRLGDLQRQRKDAKRDRRGTRRLLEPFDAAQKDVQAWRTLQQDVNDAIAELRELQTCPRCGQSARWHRRAKGCFSARCESVGCQAHWELRALPDGRGRVPVFEPDGPTAAPYEIDRLVGCDILAVPGERDDRHLLPRRDRVDPELSQLLER